MGEAFPREGSTVAVQFLLFVMTVLLIMIFWELSKINSRLKKTLTPQKTQGREAADVK